MTRHPHGGGAPARLKQLLLLLCVAQLMVILDITAVNVAMPQIANGLHINGSDIGWTITSYSLIFGSLLLLGGRAADLLGRRRMFLTGLGVFIAASVVAAASRQRGDALRGPRRPGPRRGDALAGRPVDHDGHLHRRPRRAPTHWLPGVLSAEPAPQSACSSEVR